MPYRGKRSAGPATSEPWPPTPAGTPCTSARTRLAQRRGLLTGPVWRKRSYALLARIGPAACAEPKHGIDTLAARLAVAVMAW